MARDLIINSQFWEPSANPLFSKDCTNILTINSSKKPYQALCALISFQVSVLLWIFLHKLMNLLVLIYFATFQNGISTFRHPVVSHKCQQIKENPVIVEENQPLNGFPSLYNTLLTMFLGASGLTYPQISSGKQTNTMTRFEEKKLKEIKRPNWTWIGMTNAWK